MSSSSKRRKKKKRSNANTAYAVVVGLALIGAKFYFHFITPDHEQAERIELVPTIREIAQTHSSRPQASPSLETHHPLISAPDPQKSQAAPGESLPMSVEQCRTHEAYHCVRKVFSPEVRETEDGSTETSSTCVSVGEENICVQLKTVLNSTAQFMAGADSKKSDFETGGRFNHEEYQCTFLQPGFPSDPARSRTAGVTIRVEGRELAETLRSLQRDCLARTDQPAFTVPPAEENERGLAVAEQRGDAAVTAITAEIPPEQTEMIPPPLDAAPEPIGDQFGSTPALGAND